MNLCATCKWADWRCPIWTPGFVTRYCVEYRQKEGT